MADKFRNRTGIAVLASAFIIACIGIKGILDQAVLPYALFSLMCDSAGLSMISEPYLSTVFTERLWEAFQFSWEVLGFAFLFHFTAVFPSPRDWTQRKLRIPIIYMPATLMGSIVLFCIFSDLRAPRILIAVSFFLAIGYLVGSALMLVWSYFSAGTVDRNALGLNAMVIGTIAGLVAMVIPLLVMAIAPRLDLPGRHYYPFSMAFIVAGFAFACVKQHSAQVCTRAAA
jgi:hypothetical protein